MTDELHQLLRAAADARTDLHRGHVTRTFTKDFDGRGIAGEWAFARAFHQPLDLTLRPKGDGGIDFWIPLMFSVDVKTFAKPHNLIVERGKVSADIYVLARDTGDIAKAELLGWEWNETVAAAPTRDFGYGVINHYIDAGALRPMAELRWRLAIAGFCVGDGA